MIDTKKYKKILDDGLLLDHYVVLRNIKDGNEHVPSRRIQGFINLLCKKGYIEDGVLTVKALTLVEGEPTVVLTTDDRLPVEKIPLKPAPNVEFADWAIKLHRICQQKLKDARGKQQVTVWIKGARYSYLPNPTDLGKVVLRVMAAYNLRDLEKIKKYILAYVDRCIKLDSWTPLLNYWIMKDGMSTMVTEMENPEEESSDDTTVNI